jgi:hypothetical protein
MKAVKGGNPKKVGSLLGDKPISSFFETLWYEARMFPSGDVLLQVRKRKKT